LNFFCLFCLCAWQEQHWIIFWMTKSIKPRFFFHELVAFLLQFVLALLFIHQILLIIKLSSRSMQVITKM
jgi:hypothetical protein